MSIEHIVNRVTPTPFQQIEANKLAGSSEPGSYNPDYLQAGNEQASDTNLPSAEDLDTVVAESEDNIGNVITEPVVQYWSRGPGHVSTAEVVALVLKKQLEFEEKVTAAFKHLGLDTRRFFGV